MALDPDIKEILVKCLKRASLTEAEESHLIHWIEDSYPNRRMMNLLFNEAWVSGHLAELKRMPGENIWVAIAGRLEEKNRSRERNIRWRRYLGVAILVIVHLLVAVALVFFYRKQFGGG